jgi:hypothetical protein
MAARSGRWLTASAARQVVLLTLVLTLGGGLATRAWAQAPMPAADPVAVVVDFLELFHDGYLEMLWPFGRDPILYEHELYPRVAQGDDAVKARLREWSAQGVWIEWEPVAVLAGGQLVVTEERVWADTIPEAEAPWHYTVSYLLAGGRIVAVQRVLGPEPRDRLAAEAIEGDWGVMGGLAGHRFGADGHFAMSETLRQLGTRALDAGRYEVASGSLRFVSDDTTLYCSEGDEGVWRLRFLDEDTIELLRVDEACRGFRGVGSALVLVRVVPP